jgi:hypothetical protein
MPVSDEHVDEAGFKHNPLATALHDDAILVSPAYRNQPVHDALDQTYDIPHPRDSPMSYNLGDEINLAVAFSDPVTGAAVDPTEVTLQVKDPDGNVNAYTYGASEITRVSAGNYSRPQLLDKPGKWWYRYTATGSYKGTTGDVKVEVDGSQFGNVL